MFRIVKYYFILNLYQKTKRNMVAIIVSVFFMTLVPYFFTDFIDMVESSDRYVPVIWKWILLLFLLSILIFNVLRIFKAIHIPFLKEQKVKSPDFRKERILEKDHLLSRSDLILKKYRENK